MRKMSWLNTSWRGQTPLTCRLLPHLTLAISVSKSPWWYRRSRRSYSGSRTFGNVVNDSLVSRSLASEVDDLDLKVAIRSTLVRCWILIISGVLVIGEVDKVIFVSAKLVKIILFIRRDR